MSTGTLTAFDQVGKKEDISDIITNISPTKTPFQTMIGSESIHNIVHQWQEDSLLAPAANAQIEGFTAPTASWQVTQLRSNNTQIFTKTAQVSGTTDAIKTYGRAKELAYQLGMRSAELKRDFEFALVGAVSQTGTLADGTARTMNSVGAQITLTGGNAAVVLNGVTATVAGLIAQTGATPAALSEANVVAVAQQLYVNGVDPSVLMVKPADSLKVAAFAVATGRTRYLDGGAKSITNVVETYMSPFGELKLVMNRFQRSTEAYIFEADMWKKLVLRNWERQTLAITGDFTPVMVTGEFSLKHRNYAASGLITGLSA